jgi:hypothetical protein
VRLLIFLMTLSVLSSVLHADNTGTSADDAGTFTVQDGAAPWSDRVGTWELGDIPDSLKSTDPLPQQLCGSRTLAIAGHPKSIVVGVSVADAPKFKEQFPSATETGETFTIRHPKETSGLQYQAMTLSNPPQTISGGDTPFGAGLILLKADAGPTTTPATKQ